MLLLHLQNGSSKNPFLTALPTNYEVLKKHYCVIAWDISDPKIAEKLILANERYFRCRKITEALKNKKSETFIFIPTTNTMALAGDFTNFAAITDMFIKENLNFGFDISPFVFQENLCKQLSDRDYNHFNLDKEEDEAFFRDWVSFAIFGNPSVEGQKYKEEQKNHITEVMTQIQVQVQRYSFNPKRLYVACVYICWIPLGKDFTNHVSLPVIAVQKCLNSKSRSCRIYVDSNLRVYESWVGYLSENNLAPGIFIVPQDGVYQIDCFGRVRLECIYDKKIGTKVVNTLDKVSMFAGLGSAAVGVTTLLTSVALAPVVLTGAAAAGAAVGVYSLVRGGTHLYDRNQHHESMHFKNREARAAYLNLAAGVFSFATSGATATLSYFAQNGTEIGEISISFINLMCGANIAVNGVNISNCIYDVYFNWRVSGHRPDSLQIIQLMSSVLFFAHSVYNAKSANTIISESQAQKLYEIESNLTNKQKRVFNKMIKETIRTNEGNVQQGYREVISYINNVDNIQETLAILARNNKRLHQNNVRFAVADGQIRFNGVNVDLQTFDSLSNLKKMNYFTDLPKIPEVNIKHRMTTTKTINNYFNPSSLIHSATIIYKFGSELCSEDVSSVISRFSEVVANQFMIILRKFLEKASLDEFLNKNLISLAKSTPLEIIFDFFNLRGMRIARELINSVNPDLNEKLDNLLMCIEKAIMIATMDIERVIRELLKFAITWLAQKAYTTMVDSEKSTTENDYGNNQGVVCDVCQGRHK